MKKNNNQVNSQKVKAKNKKSVTVVLIVIIILLILTIGICAGMLLSRKEITQNINNTTLGKEEMKDSNKIDENKPGGYDADYGEDNEEKKLQHQYDNEITSTIDVNIKELPSDKTTNNTGNESSNITNSSYTEEYKKIIDKNESEYPGSKYSLIYFNGDNIPDLVVNNGGVNLYMYENDKVYNLLEDAPIGVGGSKYFSYLERKGALYNYGNGYAGAISYITIKVLNSKREFDEFSIIEKGADLEDTTDSMYEQIQEELSKTAGYYYNGKKISEGEFNDKLNKASVSSDEREYENLGGDKTIEEIKKQLQ